jgi:TetR/AcrR family transcriptional regulator, cholesterol catabolism regulator
MVSTSEPLPGYKQARRGQIVRAAMNALKEQDYEHIQMRDVAESADVALGTLYRYFGSKEQVYAAVLMEWAQPIFVLDEHDSRPAEQRIRAKVRAIVAAFDKRPGFFKVCTLLQNTSDPNARTIMAEFADAAQRSLADDFGALGKRDAADIAMMLWGIISTQLTAAILHDHPMADVNRIAGAFLDLVAPRLRAAEASVRTGNAVGRTAKSRGRQRRD